MRLMRYIVGVVAIGTVAGLAAWYVWRPEAVSTVTPSRGDAAEIVYASGTVEPLTWAKVAPVVRERIVEQCDCEGSRVAKGDVLARLDDSEVRALLSEIEARLALAQEVYKRLSVLAEKSTASRQELDEAESELSRIKALKAGQEAKLETYMLRSPSDGIVLRQDGEVGEIAEPGTVLFWVGQPRPLRIVIAEVNEEDIPRVEVGQRTLLNSDAFPGRSLEATFSSVTPMGDPVTQDLPRALRFARRHAARDRDDDGRQHHRPRLGKHAADPGRRGRGRGRLRGRSGTAQRREVRARNSRHERRRGAVASRKARIVFALPCRSCRRGAGADGRPRRRAMRLLLSTSPSPTFSAAAVRRWSRGSGWRSASASRSPWQR